MPPPSDPCGWLLTQPLTVRNHPNSTAATNHPDDPAPVRQDSDEDSYSPPPATAAGPSTMPTTTSSHPQPAATNGRAQRGELMPGVIMMSIECNQDERTGQVCTNPGCFEHSSFEAVVGLDGNVNANAPDDSSSAGSEPSSGVDLWTDEQWEEAKQAFLGAGDDEDEEVDEDDGNDADDEDDGNDADDEDDEYDPQDLEQWLNDRINSPTGNVGHRYNLLDVPNDVILANLGGEEAEVDVGDEEEDYSLAMNIIRRARQMAPQYDGLTRQERDQAVLDLLTSDRAKNYVDPEPYDPAVPKTTHRTDYADPAVQEAEDFMLGIVAQFRGQPAIAQEPPAWMTNPKAREEWWKGYHADQAKKEGGQQQGGLLQGQSELQRENVVAGDGGYDVLGKLEEHLSSATNQDVNDAEDGGLDIFGKLKTQSTFASASASTGSKRAADKGDDDDSQPPPAKKQKHVSFADLTDSDEQEDKDDQHPDRDDSYEPESSSVMGKGKGKLLGQDVNVPSKKDTKPSDKQ